MIQTFSRKLHYAFVPHKENQDRPYILRTPSLTFFGALILTFKIWLLIIIALYPLEASLSTITASRIVQLTNESRSSRSLPVLATNSLLEKAAFAKAKDILQKDYFAHINPEGKEPWDFITEAGYGYLYAGENLAIGFKTAEGVHEALMESPTHRDNILNENFTEIGIAAVTGDFKGTAVTVVVEMFGSTPLSLTKILQSDKSSSEEEPPRPEPKIIEPLLPPVITSPKNNDFVSRIYSDIYGNAQKEGIIVIYADDEKIGEIKTDQKGNFRTNVFTLLQNLEEGTHIIETKIKEKNGRESGLSKEIKIFLDSSAPKIDIENSYILPLFAPGGDKFYLFLKVKDRPEKLTAYFDNRIEKIEGLKDDNSYENIFNFSPIKISESRKIVIEAADNAGNQNEEVFSLGEPTFIMNKDQKGRDFIAALSLKNKFTRFSLIILVIFIFLFFINIFVRIRHQHLPTILKVIAFLAFISLLAAI